MRDEAQPQTRFDMLIENPTNAIKTRVPPNAPMTVAGGVSNDPEIRSAIKPIKIFSRENINFRWR